MPRGSKKKYTSKQKRQAEHIEEGYEARGVSDDEAESRAWATVNKQDGGGKKSGSGRGKQRSTASARKGGKKAGKKTGGRKTAKRSSKKTASKRGTATTSTAKRSSKKRGAKKTSARKTGAKKRSRKKSSRRRA